jgi:hypothetical protein
MGKSPENSAVEGLTTYSTLINASGPVEAEEQKRSYQLKRNRVPNLYGFGPRRHPDRYAQVDDELRRAFAYFERRAVDFEPGPEAGTQWVVWAKVRVLVVSIH